MTQESKTWLKAHHRVSATKSGGIHVYIDDFVLSTAIAQSGLNNNVELEVKRCALTGTKNRAKIILTLREIESK